MAARPQSAKECERYLTPETSPRWRFSFWDAPALGEDQERAMLGINTAFSAFRTTKKLRGKEVQIPKSAAVHVAISDIDRGLLDSDVDLLAGVHKHIARVGVSADAVMHLAYLELESPVDQPLTVASRGLYLVLQGEKGWDTEMARGYLDDATDRSRELASQFGEVWNFKR